MRRSAAGSQVEPTQFHATPRSPSPGCAPSGSRLFTEADDGRTRPDVLVPLPRRAEPGPADAVDRVRPHRAPIDPGWPTFAGGSDERSAGAETPAGESGGPPADRPSGCVRGLRA